MPGMVVHVTSAFGGLRQEDHEFVAKRELYSETLS
jgi:hypothetical protein